MKLKIPEKSFLAVDYIQSVRITQLSQNFDIFQRGGILQERVGYFADDIHSQVGE